MDNIRGVLTNHKQRTLLNAMSPQQKQQHEALTNINERVSGLDDKVSDMAVLLVKMFKLWPVIGGVLAVLSFTAGLTIKAVRYDETIVKQPQFQAFEARAIKSDSTINAKVDTTNKRVDNLRKSGFVTETYHNGRNGKPDINPVN